MSCSHSLCQPRCPHPGLHCCPSFPRTTPSLQRRCCFTAEGSRKLVFWKRQTTRGALLTTCRTRKISDIHKRRRTCSLVAHCQIALWRWWVLLHRSQDDSSWYCEEAFSHIIASTCPCMQGFRQSPLHPTCTSAPAHTARKGVWNEKVNGTKTFSL